MVIARPLSRNNIRDIASQLRSVFGLSRSPFFPIVEFVELGMPQIYPRFFLEIEEERNMLECYALAVPEEHKICLREDVYERAIRHVGRDRFTIAHEVGHYLLHLPERVKLARASSKAKIPLYRDPEWQANVFAGELLIPRELIMGKSACDVARICGVSQQAAQVQLKYS